MQRSRRERDLLFHGGLHLLHHPVFLSLQEVSYHYLCFLDYAEPTHSQQKAGNRERFIAFNGEMQGSFTRGYNRQHNRTGELLEKPFGSVPKIGEKYIRNNLSYINNNGAAGRLSKGVLDYRWNLMAYFGSGHPFSERVVLNKASQRLRQALRYVDKMREDDKPLDYRIQNMLFKGLNRKESKQLLDHIIAKYNFLDYSTLLKCYGSFEKALLAMDANTGSEHDLKEEWEDYSDYRKMIETASKAGYDMERVNFRSLSKDESFNLIMLLSQVTGDNRKIRRFLHRGRGK